MTISAGPLEGIRVLDFCRVLSGPWAGQMLGDLGAEVVKIETPGTGDSFRAPPPHLKDADGRPTPESSLYLSCNRNKKSLSLDVSKPEGQAIARRLAAGSDIVIENFRAGFLKRRGLDYASLSKDDPGLVYCSISGFGQDGPYAHRAGYDSTFQAMSGMMSLTGHPDGSPGDGPMRTGPSLCDINSAMYAVIAILGALHHRSKTGRGQYIDLAMLDTTLAMVSHHAMAYLVAGEDVPRVGNGSPYGAPVGVFRCRDLRVMLNSAEDGNFAKLCGVLGVPELATDARFTAKQHRIDRQAELHVLLEARTLERGADELLDACEAVGLAVAPVNDTARAYADPQVTHRRMLREMPHPVAGTLKMVANPIRYSETPLDRYAAPPLLGEHTEEILGGRLGLGKAEVERLRGAGVI